MKLTYKELSTVLAQIEACLISRPLVALPHPEDGIEVLIPEYFLIGVPLESLPDVESTPHGVPLLQCWNLCQALMQHLWKQRSSEYMDQLNKFSKWNRPSHNVQVGNIVCSKGEQSSPTKWPIACVENVYPGQDNKVRVVAIRTSKGAYSRPVTKVATLVNRLTKFVKPCGFMPAVCLGQRLDSSFGGFVGHFLAYS